MFGGKKLNKADTAHLREMKLTTKYKFEEQIKFLKKHKAERPDYPYPCYDCLRIAKKLGMWDD